MDPEARAPIALGRHQSRLAAKVLRRWPGRLRTT
jgi:hypothetical protein